MAAYHGNAGGGRTRALGGSCAGGCELVFWVAVPLQKKKTKSRHSGPEPLDMKNSRKNQQKSIQRSWPIFVPGEGRTVGYEKLHKKPRITVSSGSDHCFRVGCSGPLESKKYKETQRKPLVFIKNAGPLDKENPTKTVSSGPRPFFKIYPPEFGFPLFFLGLRHVIFGGEGVGDVALWGYRRARLTCRCWKFLLPRRRKKRSRVLT